MQMTLGKAVAIALARQRRKAKAALDRALKRNGFVDHNEEIDVARRRLRAVNIIIEEYKNEGENER